MGFKQAIFNHLDSFVSTLFVNYRGRALLRQSQELGLNQNSNQAYQKYIKALACKAYFEWQVRRKFPLGFVLSLVPGTSAFKARIYYKRAFEALIPSILSELNDTNHLASYQRRAARWSLQSFSFLHDLVLEEAKIRAQAASQIKLYQGFFWKDLLCRLPLINDLFERVVEQKPSRYEIVRTKGPIPRITSIPGEKIEKIVSKNHNLQQLAHSFVNPLRIVTALLDFCHQLHNRFIDWLLPDKRSYATIPYYSKLSALVLKGLLALIFVPVRGTVKIAEGIIDLALAIVYEALSPLIYLTKAAIQGFRYARYVFVISSVDELQKIKIGRQIIKGHYAHGECNLMKELYEKTTEKKFPNQKEYANLSHALIYNSKTEKDTPVLILFSGKNKPNKTAMSAKQQAESFKQNREKALKFFQKTNDLDALTYKHLEFQKSNGDRPSCTL